MCNINALWDLGSSARQLVERDYGSEDATAAQNAFFELFEQLYPDDYNAVMEHELQATSLELIDAALGKLPPPRPA